MPAVAGSRWQVERLQLIDQRLPEGSGLRSEHRRRVAFDQVPVVVFEFLLQSARRPAGISKVEAHVIRRFAPVVRSNSDRTAAHAARYPGRFPAPSLIADHSQRLALDQQQVGGIEGIVGDGLWCAIDEWRNLAARHFRSAQRRQSEDGT